MSTSYGTLRNERGVTRGLVGAQHSYTFSYILVPSRGATTKPHLAVEILPLGAGENGSN